MSMNAKKRVNGSWVNTTPRQYKTATDTITTFPAVLYTTGTTATVVLKGQAVQSGTPTLDSPIMPQGTGDRTANLFDKTQPTTTTNKYLLSNGEESSSASGWAVSAYIPVNGEYVTISDVGGNLPSICAYDSNMQFVRGKNYAGTNITTINISECSYIRFSYVPSVQGNTAMLNYGSTALPYEPYGVKIPISSANTTTPIYLGEVETTRKIKKLVFDGTEAWRLFALSGATNVERFYLVVSKNSKNYGSIISSHFKTQIDNSDTEHTRFGGSPINEVYIYISRTIATNAAELKSYLAQQYANGTPVTMWYVLATDETAVVNEPLMKIGAYADEVSNISIPTITGKNIVDVETVLKPSEVSFNYAGWHTAVVHKRINGAWD